MFNQVVCTHTVVL